MEGAASWEENSLKKTPKKKKKCLHDCSVFLVFVRSRIFAQVILIKKKKTCAEYFSLSLCGYSLPCNRAAFCVRKKFDTLFMCEMASAPNAAFVFSPPSTFFSLSSLSLWLRF